MESKEVLLNGGTLNGGFVSNGKGLKHVNGGNGFELVNGENGFEHVAGDEMGNGSLADEVLEDLEEYWEDINERLMISRMVGDSVIRGMVTAVEQDAAEKIRAKELEVLSFKARLESFGVGIGEFEPVRLLMEQKTCKVGNSGRFSSFSDTEHDKMREDLHTFRTAAIEQLEEAKKEMDCAKGFNSIKKISSSSELVGLSGILPEKQSKRWLHLDEMLENLKSTVDTFCTKTDSSLLSSMTCLVELQHEFEMSRKIEDIVTATVLKSVKEEFEGNWKKQNAQYRNINTVSWLEKLNDMSSMRTQLDFILKSLSISEAGLVSHGSHDLENSPHKPTLHTVAPFSEKNGTLEASDIHVAESYDFLQLKHMSKEELVNYFNNIITNLNRDHESALQKKTEKYFLLKREYLKHRRYVVTHWKDEEFDVLRKRIPEVILKLEDFLSESDRFPALVDHIESIEKLNDRVEGLLSENRDLRDCLANKENEVKHLKSEVSGAVGKLLDHSLASKSIGKLVADLKSSVEDSRLEALLNEEVYKYALRELIKQKTSDHEDSSMKFLKAASYPAESRGKYEIEDSDIESSIFQGLNALMFKEAIKDVEGKLINLHQGVLIEKQNRINLEKKVIEKENQLRLDVNEKERLKQEILSLGTTIEQKQKLAVELSISLSKEREKFELASGELSSLRKSLSLQQSLVSETNRQCESLSAKLLEATDQIEVYKEQIHKINEKLDQTKDLLTEANKERNMAFALAQDRLDKLLLSEAREKKLKEEIELSIDNIHGLTKIFDNFDDRISRAISKNDLRLEDATSQLTDLTKIAGVLRRTELMYKHKLERRCADLKMAESEVDLLGDEVDALLRLLEKIYIALDHYSPILKHYPGIIEILKLVRRELSGESTKLSRLTSWQG